ncbi:hypothetical protein V5O48_004536 [Marasmius crinis-equi]|uniref:non-specific serine/threonine protein kinase n=1 Tax=Marasmius crinis-equi TaxID=585013 RepID=A0ABR3FPU5_9AGAR
MPSVAPNGTMSLDSSDSTKNVIGALQSLIADRLSGEPKEDEKAYSPEQLVTVVDGLSSDILSKFSYAEDVEWCSMVDLVKVVELSLEVIQRVVPRARSIFFTKAEFIKTLFVQLFTLCNSLDLWAEDGEVEITEGVVDPKALRDNAVQTLVDVLRCLGSDVPAGVRAEDYTRKPLREIIEGILSVCEDLLQPNVEASMPFQISLFDKPRFQPVTPSQDLQSLRKLKIVSNTEIPRFASLAVRIAMNVLHPPLLSDWFVLDLDRRATRLLLNAFEYCILSSLPADATAKPLVRIVSSVPSQSSYVGVEGLSRALFTLPIRLLRYRLSAGPVSGWGSIDTYLNAVIPQMVRLPTKSEFFDVLGCLYEVMDLEEGDDADSYQGIAVCFIRTCLQRFEPQMIDSVKDAVRGANLGAHSNEIAKALDDRLSASPQMEAEAVANTVPPAPTPWRQRFDQLAERIFYPDRVDWMDDDDESRYIQKALDDIARRIKSSSRSNPGDLLILLQDLPGLLAGHENLATFPFCASVVRRLMGESTEPAARKQVYGLLSSMLRNHTSAEFDMSTRFMENVVMKGVTDQDRGVRLSASTTAAELVELYKIGRSASIWTHIDTFFSYFYNVSSTASAGILDTLLITMGKISRSSHPDIMGQALCFLVTLLSHKNVVIRGNAYMQIISATKHHKKMSAYTLLLPYMDRLAPFLVTRIASDRALLGEACKLLGMAQSDFVAITLSRTLPTIVANCDRKVLSAVAKDINSKASAIIMKHAHEILAYVFLLPTAQQTDEALKFMIKTLAASTGSGAVNAQSVIKSCLVSLLAEIVTKLGSENAQRTNEALAALEKVEQTVSSTDGRGEPTGLLKSYILGIITNINDMLQDVQGKKSVERKREIIRSLGSLVEQIGSSVSVVAPQIMATFQTMASIPELAEATLQSWHRFLVTLGPSELGPHIGLTSAVFVTCWSSFPQSAKDIAKESLRYIVFDVGRQLDRHIGDLVDLPDVPELYSIQEQLSSLRGSPTPKEVLVRILDRSATDNYAMVVQGLRELKDFMTSTHPEVIRELLSGATFDPLIGDILVTLLNAASREDEDGDAARLLSFECLSILGTVDIDRCELKVQDSEVIVIHNFTDTQENEFFAMHLISTVLVRAFRSTSDIKYQSHLAYTIQELLKVCGFKHSGKTPTLVARKKLSALPQHVVETITPLLDTRYTLRQLSSPDPIYPIYPTQTTYREWIQLWVTHLISLVNGHATPIFSVFCSAVRNKDVVVAHSLLPHLVLNLLSSNNEDNVDKIRLELRAVLNDQVDPASTATPEKRLLCAQAIFMILDHLNRWVRRVRQLINNKKERRHTSPEQSMQLSVIDSLLGSINHDLMGQAALQCKAYARSLMNFEMHILKLSNLPDNDGSNYRRLAPYYEKLHEIYAHLDEPDSMEGISTLILSPSLEHQIRHHEISGSWTSAQSCWEVRIQQEPNNVDFHLGLLRCLRNLGHYDSLRTHVRGVLTKQPSWQSSLVGFQVESAWMVGDWQDVQKIVDSTPMGSKMAAVALARVLLALRSKDDTNIAETLCDARLILGEPVAAAGIHGYRRAHESALNLHLVHELDMIYKAMMSPDPQSLDYLSHILEARLDATFPTFHAREAILGLRRTAFALLGNGSSSTASPSSEVGHSWLASSKIARKAGQWQTAYSAILQAEQNNAHFSFMESSKLMKATGEPLRALRQLEDAMRLLGMLQVPSTTPRDESVTAKAHLLRARWMDESERFDVATVFKAFNNATELQPKWESGHFYVGRFQDENWKNLPNNEKATSRGLKMNHYTVKYYAKAIKLGSKYVYQTVPRLLTLWLDLGENDKIASQDIYTKINDVVSKAIKESPMFKWFTAFPQMVSRLDHNNAQVRPILFKLIEMVIKEYPKQALWLFACVMGSKNATRKRYGTEILAKVRNNPAVHRTQVPGQIKLLESLTDHLLALCNHPVGDKREVLNFKKMFPSLYYLGTSELLVPLQVSLTASLPPTSSTESNYQPFPPDAPTFAGWHGEIEVLGSLAKPRKLTLNGSNGQRFTFLAKPKDDLRKDARLMELNSIINKLLKGNPDSRRRQLHIRTYGVVTLNEECGLIQWVPNTQPIRPILLRCYSARGIQAWVGMHYCLHLLPFSFALKTADMVPIFHKLGAAATDSLAATMFEDEVLKKMPPVFHEWFIETFPEPTTWLSSRLNYGRTLAVMSMVGFIIGLGDRHCENILMDENTGDAIHVDFNCLFEQGKQLATPERVPFRLTQNIVSALGVSGVEGIFRTTCEITLQILRDNRDLLMSVLDAFIHDPLVDFEEERKKKNRYKANVDLKKLAREALHPIEKKLKGLASTVSKEKHAYDKEISTSNLVQMLIQEAMDNRNLSRMYVGWSPMH